MCLANIDYVSTYFDYPSLIKTHRKPTYKTLQELNEQLKANISAVASDLGGGGNGHLGLVCTRMEYTSANPLGYMRPIHPGLLEIEGNTTQHAV